MITVSATTGPRELAPARPLLPIARGAADGVTRFPPGVRAGDRARSTEGEIIDVEVLWEDAGDHRPLRSTTAPRVGRAPLEPLRLLSPEVAMIAYRSASTTRGLPHALVDLFA